MSGQGVAALTPEGQLSDQTCIEVARGCLPTQWLQLPAAASLSGPHPGEDPLHMWAFCIATDPKEWEPSLFREGHTFSFCPFCHLCHPPTRTPQSFGTLLWKMEVNAPPKNSSDCLPVPFPLQRPLLSRDLVSPGVEHPWASTRGSMQCLCFSASSLPLGRSVAPRDRLPPESGWAQQELWSTLHRQASG